MLHLLDIRTGRLRRFVDRSVDPRTVAGFGQRCLGRTVAVYVDPEGGGLVLQVGRGRVPLDGETRVSRTVSLKGAQSRAVIERAGHRTLRFRTITPWRPLSSRFESSYDYVDESFEDATIDIEELSRSEQRRRAILDTADHHAGPWHLLGGD